jgi:hypothetical protein
VRADRGRVKRAKRGWATREGTSGLNWQETPTRARSRRHDLGAARVTRRYSTQTPCPPASNANRTSRTSRKVLHLTARRAQENTRPASSDETSRHQSGTVSRVLGPTSSRFDLLPYFSNEVPHLTSVERALFDKLRNNVWGEGIRLEQERLPWPEAIAAVRFALDSA